MKKFEEKIWQEGEYNYRAAYGFVPNVHAYLHDDDEERDCMLVVPGGAYCMVVPPEGNIPALEFYEKGMNVFVLTYTTDITTSIPLKKQPLNDIARAVRFIRKRENEYKIAGKKLFVCGFSAGGHVCASLAVHYMDVEEKNPEYASVSCKPTGAILSYPVITSGEFSHEFSFETLLGKDATKEEKEYFSIEKQVTEDTIPCFIWQTATDDLVPVENSYLMAEALREKGVTFAHYVFPTGFHGLSVPSEDFFAGRFEEYTMDQVFRAVNAIKEGKGIEVSERRCEELKIQFADKPENQEGDSNENAGPQFGDADPLTLFKDVRMWPDLAMEWMGRL